LSGFNLQAIKILAEKNIIDKESILEIINTNRNSYNNVRNLLESHLNVLNEIEANILKDKKMFIYDISEITGLSIEEISSL
jgi:hypothetical protein